jgi:hypothetical protein
VAKKKQAKAVKKGKQKVKNVPEEIRHAVSNDSGTERN